MTNPKSEIRNLNSKFFLNSKFQILNSKFGVSHFIRSGDYSGVKRRSCKVDLDFLIKCLHQHRRHCLAIKRSREEIALSEIAAKRFELFVLMLSFYAFGNYFQAQIARERYDGTNYLRIIFGFCHAANKRLVDLQVIDRETV